METKEFEQLIFNKLLFNTLLNKHQTNRFDTLVKAYLEKVDLRTEPDVSQAAGGSVHQIAHPEHKKEDRVYLSSVKDEQKREWEGASSPPGVVIYTGARGGDYFLQTHADNPKLAEGAMDQAMQNATPEKRMYANLGADGAEAFVEGWSERQESRLEWASSNKDDYESRVEAVSTSPVSTVRKAEYALITANCNLNQANAAWMAALNIDDLNILAAIFDGKHPKFGSTTAVGMGEKGFVGTKDALLYGGGRAGALSNIRSIGAIAEGDDFPIGTTDSDRTRTMDFFWGLGLAKYSFASSIIHGNKSEIVCIDTHMAQIYLGGAKDRDDSANAERRKRKASQVFPDPDGIPVGSPMRLTTGIYKYLENYVKHEAQLSGLSPFAYQWSAWDWQRNQNERSKNPDHKDVKESHSVLTTKEPDKYDLNAIIEISKTTPTGKAGLAPVPLTDV